MIITRIIGLGKARELLGQSVVAVGYVVNASRTKLLMRYNQRLEQWVPAGSVQDEDQISQSIMRQYIFKYTGLAARPVTGIDAAVPTPEVFLLEADENDAEKYELEEQYDAQWLTKDQVLACTCIQMQAKDFANALLS